MIRPATAAERRFGMTLIELLVVVGILGLLSVIVLPAISGNEENRLGRAAAEQVAGLINQARNEAMGSGRPAGVTIRPVSTGAAAAIDLFRCRVPPAYSGAIDPAKLQFALSTQGLSVHSTTLNCLTDISSAGVAQNDLVQFDGRGPVYQIASNPNAAGFTIALRTADAGQTTANTPWPPENIAMTFAIDRQPRIVGSPVSLSQSRCVDLRWSGFEGASGFELFGAGNTISVTFDSRGQVQQIIRGGSRLGVVGPVFLLVGRVDRAGNDSAVGAGPSASDDSVGANWQYPTSYWIAIDPTSGQVRTAECKPNVANEEGSREWARSALVSQGL